MLVGLECLTAKYDIKFRHPIAYLTPARPDCLNEARCWLHSELSHSILRVTKTITRQPVCHIVPPESTAVYYRPTLACSRKEQYQPSLLEFAAHDWLI